jgi:hypothetical protein
MPLSRLPHLGGTCEYLCSHVCNASMGCVHPGRMRAPQHAVDTREPSCTSQLTCVCPRVVVSDTNIRCMSRRSVTEGGRQMAPAVVDGVRVPAAGARDHTLKWQRVQKIHNFVPAVVQQCRYPVRSRMRVSGENSICCIIGC